MFISKIDNEQQMAILSDGTSIPFDRFSGAILIGHMVVMNPYGSFYCMPVEVSCPSCGN